MASIAVEPVIAAITAAITAAVEKGTEAAVVAAISAAVTEVVEAAVTSAISAAIAAGVVSSVTGAITAATTKAVESALEKGLDKAVKDVIGSQGISDLSKAMTAIPSEDVVDELVRAALDAVKPHLWVFSDPTFIRLSKFVRILRAFDNGEHPDDGYDDDDTDEEKCRYFQGPETEDDADDFIFLSAYSNAGCAEGDEVYSMSAQWKNLVSLVDDPIGGHYVTELFQEIFDSCADDEEEGEQDGAVLVGGGIPPLEGKKKIKMKFKYGKIVPFANKKVYNVKGSSVDKRSPNWLKTYMKTGFGKCGKCYIKTEDPVCGHTSPTMGNIVGGHMWNPKLKKKDKGLYYYILPICKRHNKRVVYDEPKPDGSGWLKTASKSFALKITSTNKVPGWKGKSTKLTGGTKLMLMSQPVAESVQQEMTETFPEQAVIPHQEKTGIVPEHPVIQQQMTETALEQPVIPNQENLSNWIMEEAHKIALEFSKGPIEIVFNEVSDTVLGELKVIIKKAGDDAEKWAKHEGNSIMKQSLIPIYGIYKATKRLSHLKKDALNRFHSKARSGLADYKNKCLDSKEQAHRKKRLLEETEKVIASQKWKDQMVSFETSISMKVPSAMDPKEN